MIHDDLSEVTGTVRVTGRTQITDQIDEPIRCRKVLIRFLFPAATSDKGTIPEQCEILGNLVALIVFRKLLRATNA